MHRRVGLWYRRVRGGGVWERLSLPDHPRLEYGRLPQCLLGSERALEAKKSCRSTKTGNPQTTGEILMIRYHSLIVQPAAGDEKFCPKNVKIYDFCSAAPAVSDEPQGSILRLLDWQKDVDSNMLEPSEVTTGGDTNTPSVPRKERSGSTHARNELRLELRVASDTTRNWVSRFRSKRLLEHCSQDAPSMVALR